MFAFGVALYGTLAVGAVIALVVLVGIVLKRPVSSLLRTSAILYASALLSFLVPVLTAGNKLAGAIVVMAVLPISLTLLAAAGMCVVLWAGRAWARGSERTQVLSEKS
jgi:hypothetical protein